MDQWELQRMLLGCGIPGNTAQWRSWGRAEFCRRDMRMEQEDQDCNLVVRVTRMDHTHVQQFLREHYHNDGINKSSCARGAPPKMKKHSVPVAFARVASREKGAYTASRADSGHTGVPI